MLIAGEYHSALGGDHDILDCDGPDDCDYPGVWHLFTGKGTTVYQSTGLEEQIMSEHEEQESFVDEYGDPFSGAEFAQLMAIRDNDVFDPNDFDFYTYDGKIYLGVNDSDLFAWGYSGHIPFSPSDIPDLEKAYEDLAEISTTAAYRHYTKLWCARKVGQRPQGAYYSYFRKETWPLFDACGPERETGYGNPYKPGQYKIFRQAISDRLIRELLERENPDQELIDKYFKLSEPSKKSGKEPTWGYNWHPLEREYEDKPFPLRLSLTEHAGKEDEG